MTDQVTTGEQLHSKQDPSTTANPVMRFSLSRVPVSRFAIKAVTKQEQLVHYLLVSQRKVVLWCIGSMGGVLALVAYFPKDAPYCTKLSSSEVIFVFLDCVGGLKFRYSFDFSAIDSKRDKLASSGSELNRFDSNAHHNMFTKFVGAKVVFKSNVLGNKLFQLKFNCSIEMFCQMWNCSIPRQDLTFVASPKITQIAKRVSPKPPTAREYKRRATIVMDAKTWNKSGAVKMSKVPLEATVPEGCVRISVKYFGVNSLEPTGINYSNFTGADLPIKPFVEIVGVVTAVGDHVTRISAENSVLGYSPSVTTQFDSILDLSQEFVYVIPRLDSRYLLATTPGVSAALCSRFGPINEFSRVLIECGHFASSSVYRQMVAVHGCQVTVVVDHAGADEPNTRQLVYNPEVWHELRPLYNDTKIDVAFVPLRADRHQYRILPSMRYFTGFFFGFGDYGTLTAHSERLVSIFSTMPFAVTPKLLEIGHELAGLMSSFREEVLNLIDLISADRVVDGLCPITFNGLASVSRAIVHSLDRNTIGKVIVTL